MNTFIRPLFLLFFCFVYASNIALAQVPPQGINYQAVARDASGKVLAGKKVSIKFEISYNLSSGATETYAESHKDVQTSNFGVFTAVIGKGVKLASLSFSDIKWSENSDHFIEIFVDETNTENYIASNSIGKTVFQSVPYALYAGNVQPGTKFYTSTQPTTANDGDYYIDGNGSVFQYTSGAWGNTSILELKGLPGNDGQLGATGAPGVNGNPGKNGFNPYVIIENIVAGNANCPSGGKKIIWGIDSVLPFGSLLKKERVDSASICNGVNLSAVDRIVIGQRASSQSVDGCASGLVILLGKDKTPLNNKFDNGEQFDSTVVCFPANNGLTSVITDNIIIGGDGTSGSPVSLKPGVNNGDILKWTGTKWELATDNNTGLTSVSTEGTVVTGDGTTADKVRLKPGTAAGQILKWDGTKWDLSTDANSGLTSVSTEGTAVLGDGTIGDKVRLKPGTAAGQILKWDGTKWDLSTDANSGFTNPMNSVGDIIYGDVGGLATRLAGTLGFLKSTGAAAPSWSAINFSDLAGTLTLVGDVSGSHNATSVDKIKGASLGTTTATDKNILVADGTKWNSVAMTGDATIANTGALTLKNTGTVGTYPKVTTDAQGRVTSGSSLSATDIPSLDASKITTGTFSASQIPNLDWTKITSGKPTTLSGYGITDGFSNSLTDSRIFVGNSSNIATAVPLSGDATISNTGALTLKNTGTAGTYTKVTTDAQGRVSSGTTLADTDIPNLDAGKITSGAFPIVRGGTGLATTPTNGQLLIGNGTGYTLNTITGGAGITVTNSSGGITIASVASSAITGLTLDVVATGPGLVAATIQNGAVNSVKIADGTIATVDLANSSVTSAKIADGTIAAVDIAAGAVDLTTTTVTNTLPIGKGGTGVSTLPANGQLLIGNGTAYTLNTLTAGSGITITPGSGTITIASTSGFTNPMTSLGDIIYGGGLGAATRLAGAAGFLKSTGAAAPSWSAINFSDLAGTLTLVGDVSGSHNLTSVDKIKGASLGTTTATDKNILVADGTKWNSVAVTGDATITNAGALNLINTTTASTKGTATAVPQITYDAKGRITGVTEVPITIAPSGSAGGDLTGTYPNPTLTTTGVTAGSYGTSTTVPSITVDSKGRVTGVTNTTISVPASGTAGGDLTGTYPSPTLTTTGVTAGSYGSSTTVPAITVDSKGRVTGVTNTTITGIAPSGAAGGDLAGTYPSPTLTTTGVTAGSYGSSTTVPAITVDSKGRVTGVTNTTITGIAPSGAAGGDLTGTYPNPTIGTGKVTSTSILDGTIAAVDLATGAVDLSTTKVTGTLPVNKGGTNSSTALNNNRLMYSSGGAIVEFPAGTSGNVLVSGGTGAPTWSTASLLPTGTAGQTLFNNAGTWTATSNLVNNGTNIGIGSTAPTAKLDISSTNAIDINTSSTLSTTGAVFGLDVFKSQTGTGSSYGVNISSQAAAGSSFGLFVNSANSNAGGTAYGIYTNVTGLGTKYAAILMGGNVGIGITTPGAMLDVKGDMKVGILTGFTTNNTTADSLVIKQDGGTLKGLKLNYNLTEFLRSDGTWQAPPSSSGWGLSGNTLTGTAPNANEFIGSLSGGYDLIFKRDNAERFRLKTVGGELSSDQSDANLLIKNTGSSTGKSSTLSFDAATNSRFSLSAKTDVINRFSIIDNQANQERFIISNTTGNIGIATILAIEPLSKLQVNGDIGLGSGTATGNAPLVVWLNASAGIVVGDIVEVTAANTVSKSTINSASVVGVAMEASGGPNPIKIAVAGIVEVNTSSSIVPGQHIISSGTGLGVGIGSPIIQGSSIGVCVQSISASKAKVLLK